MRARTAILIPALLLACWPACSDGADLRAQMQARILETVSARTSSEVSRVACPDEARLEEGARFACTAMLASGPPIPIRVRMTGDTTFEFDWSALDRWKVESQVGSAMRQAWPTLALRQVTCPPDADLSPGARATCRASILEGTEVEVPVAIGDDRSIDYYRPRGVLSLPALERAILDRLGEDGASADCGGEVRYAPPRSTFECAVRYPDGNEGHAVVTVRDWEGSVAWVVR